MGWRTLVSGLLCLTFGLFIAFSAHDVMAAEEDEQAKHFVHAVLLEKLRDGVSQEDHHDARENDRHRRRKWNWPQ